MIKVRTWGVWELAAAVGAAWWIEKLVTLEWSYPYCSVLDDGPAGAVRGFPLPYQQASVVTSGTDFFIPWLYVVNLAAIAAGIFLLMRPLASRLGASNPRRRKLIVVGAGTLLLVTAIAFEVLVLSMGVWHPIPSFSGAPRYRDLRPVTVRVLGQPRDCTASPFWFPVLSAEVSLRVSGPLSLSRIYGKAVKGKGMTALTYNDALHKKSLSCCFV